MAKSKSSTGDQEPKIEYGMLVTIKQDQGMDRTQYNVFHATIVKLSDYGCIKSLSDYEELANLTIRDQQSTDFPLLDGGNVYMDASYVSVTLTRAHMYVAVLGKLDRALERERAKRGSEHDYADKLVRIAIALGIKKFVRATPNNRNGYEYQYDSLGDGASWIRMQARLWTEAHCGVTAS